jgi:hypothetical protein
MFIEEIRATLQLGTGALLLPHTDMVTSKVGGCGLNSMMRNEKVLVASERQGLSVADGQANQVA